MSEKASPGAWRSRSPRFPKRGLHREIEAGETERQAIAALAGLRELPRLAASFDLVACRRRAASMSAAACSGQVGQTCVVTLEPLTSEVDEEIDVMFSPDVAAGRGRDRRRRRRRRCAGGRPAGADRQRRDRSRGAGGRIPDARARSLSAQAGRGVRAGDRSRPIRPIIRSRRWRRLKSPIRRKPGNRPANPEANPRANERLASVRRCCLSRADTVLSPPDQ